MLHIRVNTGNVSHMTTTAIPRWTMADRMRKARTSAGLSQSDICEAHAFSTISTSTIFCTLPAGHDGVHEAWGVHGLMQSWTGAAGCGIIVV